VAKYGSRRRPSEPENVGSNPTGPAIKMPLSAKAALYGLICSLACGTVPGPSQIRGGDRPMAGERIEELKRRVDEQREALKSLAESLEGEDRGGTFSKIKLAFNKTSDKIKNPLNFSMHFFRYEAYAFGVFKERYA